MELMQYINTLATSGKRYSLHFLKDKDLELLNNVDVDNKYIERVKLGLKMVMESGGTGASYINKKYKAAGKTGTAQSFIDTNYDGKIDKETISASFGAYMPYDNPRLSIAVFSPNVSDRSSSYMSKVNRKITKEVTDLYFDKYDVKISLNN
jgi:cell division protein FtsI/penicillin-binding protein 2